MPAVTDPLVLPSHVVLTAVADLPEAVRTQFEHDEGDVAVTRLRARTPSTIVSADAAQLLGAFRSPTTIVDAVLAYSTTHGAAPQEVLEGAFPLIQSLVNGGLLVPEGTAAETPTEASLDRDAPVGDTRIVRLVQLLEDTELYQARHADGSYVALKVMRPGTGPRGAALIEHEAAVLRHLVGQPAPAFVEAGIVGEGGDGGGRPYLAMEWVSGVPLPRAAAERRERAPGDPRVCLPLALALLDAYAALHARGTLHADVHPGNVLVAPDGRVRLVDFGLAIPASGDRSVAGRGGVAFFFEPEYAEARRAGTNVPQASARGEQYAVAALLYHIFTGTHYLDFSLEPDVMLRQIAEEAPASFESRGVQPWPAVEAVLGRALAKETEQRFESVVALAEALRAAASDDAPSPEEDPWPTVGVRSDARALLTRVLETVGWDGSLRSGPLPAPSASVNYGAAGIAYLLYRVAGRRSDADLLSLADVWASRAATEVEEATGFYNPSLELDEPTVGRISPYHTPSGVWAVQALVAQSIGDASAFGALARAYADAIAAPCENLDLVLGQASALLGAALLLEALPPGAEAAQPVLTEAGEPKAEAVRAAIAGAPPISEATAIDTLGLAHGWAGLLYVLLRWAAATGAEPPGVHERLHQLADLAEPVGRGCRWPWKLRMDPPAYMPGWCNGSAGYIYLYALAHRLLGEDRYADVAERAAWNCWEDPAQAANLCCGLAGRAYALLHWHAHTADPAWRYRGQVRAEQAAALVSAQMTGEYDGYAHSLYKGEAGVAALVADLEEPAAAALPFFEPEGFPRSSPSA